MKCPECQSRLAVVPTAETQLDVCPAGHGLWLDPAEINFFVEQCQALVEAARAGAPAESGTGRPCPRCGGELETRAASSAAVLPCRGCGGWWLMHGSLTRLNAAYHGGGVSIRVDEDLLYRRAVAARRPARPSPADCLATRRSSPVQNLTVWALIVGGLLSIVGIALSASFHHLGTSSRWDRDSDELFLYLITGLVAGVGLFGYGFVINGKKRLIESIPTSPVRSLAVGLVEVAGSAQSGQTVLQSPFSHVPCVLYSYKVEEHRGSANNAQWVTVARGLSEEPFFVEDSTGSVMIVPFDAEIVVADDRTYWSNWLGALPQEAAAGLARLGIATATWLERKKVRCTEAYIRPGDPIYVLGTAQDNPAQGASYENAARLFIGSARDEPFIISDRSEKDLVRRLGWQSLALLYGGPALTVACLVAILKLYVSAGP